MVVPHIGWESSALSTGSACFSRSTWLGENMANYPQELDERENLQKICTYWDDFHSCATTALADCQEGATDLWEKLKKESRALDFRGSLFELCGGGNAASGLAPRPGLTLLLTALSAIVTWLAF